jgi:tRNA wybutosine-synthesizing protein 1
VAKEWKWKTDDPHYIVEAAVNMHISMIKETKGIPGVRMDRWKEAHTVKHCALSLVGEPIMYPRIDELLGDLHSRKISTFLVTNGQHPPAIEQIRPITQLYVVMRPRDQFNRRRPSSLTMGPPEESLVLLKSGSASGPSNRRKGLEHEVAGYAALFLGKVSLLEVRCNVLR